MKRLLCPLTDRQLAVLALVAKGLTSQQIAGELSLSRRSVDTAVYRICRAMGVTSRNKAVIKAIADGLLGPIRKDVKA